MNDLDWHIKYRWFHPESEMLDLIAHSVYILRECVPDYVFWNDLLLVDQDLSIQDGFTLCTQYTVIRNTLYHMP